MSAGDAILDVRGLSVRFGGLKAVDDVSLRAGRGAITAVIGPNGAGKSTLFNLVSGAVRPMAGQVLLDGQDITGQPPQRLLAAGLARSFQITNLFFELPVRENLRLAAQFVEPGPWWLGLRHVRASREALRVCELAARALAVHLLIAAQACELRGGVPGRPGIAAVVMAIRELSPALDGDRPLDHDIEAVYQSIAAGELGRKRTAEA